MANSDNRDSRNPNNDNNSSSSFEQYNRSLNNNSNSLDNNTKALYSVIRDFERSISSFNSDFKSSSNNFNEKFKKATKEYDNSRKSSDKSLGDTVKSIAKDAANLYYNYTKQAFREVYSTYNSNLSKITANMQMSNKQYSEMVRKSVSQIQGFKDSSGNTYDLGKQFSSVDFINSLQSVLDTGLRGDEAQRQAYQNLIANKLLPSIKTNTESYRKMSKEFGTAFNENTVAFAKYTERVLGAEGIDEGKWNSVQDQMQAIVRVAAGSDSDKASEMMNQLQAAVSYLENAGISSDEFISEIRKSYLDPLGSSGTLSQLMDLGSGKTSVEYVLNEGKIPELVSKYISAITDSGKGGGAQVSSMVTGGDAQTAAEVLAAKSRGELDNVSGDLTKFLEQYNKDTEYSNQLNAAAAGSFQNATDAFDKNKQNTTTMAAVLSSGIPHFGDSLDSIERWVKSIAGLLLTKGSGLYGKPGNWFSKGSRYPSGGPVSDYVDEMPGLPGNTKTGVQGKLSQFKTLMSRGATGAGIKGSSAYQAAGAAGVAAGALVGGGLTIYDAVTGYKEGGAGKAVTKALTGAGSHDSYADTDGMSAFKDAAGDIAKNTAKYAAIGSIIPGIGTGVGAAVGAVSGAIGAIAEYNSTQNQLARATKEYAESLEELNATQQKYEETTKTTDDALTNLSKVANINGEATDEQTKAFNSLKKAYPDLLANVNDVSGLDKEYVDLLKLKIEYEKEAAKDDLRESLEKSTKDGYNLTKKSLNSIEDTNVIQSTKELADSLLLDSKGLTPQEFSSQVTAIASKNGVSEKDLVTYYLEKTGVGGKAVQNKDGTWRSSKNRLSLLGDTKNTGFNPGVVSGKINLTSEEYLNSVETAEPALSESYNRLVDENKSFNTLLFKDGKLSLDEIEKSKESVVNYNNIASELVKNSTKSSISSTREKYSSEGLRNDTNNLVRPSEIVKVDKDIFKDSKYPNPAFKVGLNTVPYDNFSALLHEGEMVLPKASADQLRSIGNHGSGISGVISTMSELSKVQATAVPSPTQSSTGSLVVTAIQQQTDSLLKSLSDIRTLISSISPKSSVSKFNSSTVSENMLTYQGV